VHSIASSQLGVSASKVSGSQGHRIAILRQMLRQPKRLAKNGYGLVATLDRCSVLVCSTPYLLTESLRRRETSLCARSSPEQEQQRPYSERVTISAGEQQGGTV